MIVSGDWLGQYVRLDMPRNDLTHRLTMSGLNVEGISQLEGDFALDLEVTSNRPDCLGHIGVAREISALFETELTIPPAQPPAVPKKTAALTAVENEADDLCPQYFARVIRGIKVGPSPEWLQKRLRTLGIAAINNVVDITNYVLMECGQPLHAFDLDKLREKRIVVRRARAGEKMVASNGREYGLHPEMCVIADAQRPVAIGGVMGGLETEIGDRTTDVLIETAEFLPLSIRNTARALSLHSDSSYRFERGVDPLGLDWASRRCCELILELAGGQLLDEPVFAGRRPSQARDPVTLRFDQLQRILGIEISPEEAVHILTALGLVGPGSVSDRSDGGDRSPFIPPSWRRDLTREADLIEEVARIHGYETIPEDVPLPVIPTAKSRRDRVLEVVRDVLTAAGFFEAVTLSFVSDELCDLFTPRGALPKLRVAHSSRSREDVLRQSLIPSLLVSRRENERHGIFDAQLFEIARVYLPEGFSVGGSGLPIGERGTGNPELGTTIAEPTMIGLVGGRPLLDMKGVVETLASALNRAAVVGVREADVSPFVAGRGAEVSLGGQPWGWLGEIEESVSDKFGLQETVTVAELDLAVLEQLAELTPTYTPPAQFPAVARDLNFVLDEAVTWRELEDAVRDAAGPLAESVSFGGQYRGKGIPADRKSYVVRLTYRSGEQTLTHEEVEEAQARVIQACEQQLAARLRSGGTG